MKICAACDNEHHDDCYGVVGQAVCDCAAADHDRCDSCCQLLLDRSTCDHRRLCGQCYPDDCRDCTDKERAWDAADQARAEDKERAWEL